MILVSHRGNLSGPDPHKENNPNQINKTLFPDSTGAEYVASGSNDHIQDFYCDGFKLRNTNNRFNSDGQTYIYMAFSDQPWITTYWSSPTAR